jgi:uncharacterized protein (UPF0212 family)
MSEEHGENNIKKATSNALNSLYEAINVGLRACGHCFRKSRKSRLIILFISLVGLLVLVGIILAILAATSKI